MSKKIYTVVETYRDEKLGEQTMVWKTVFNSYDEAKDEIIASLTGEMDDNEIDSYIDSNIEISDESREIYVNNDEILFIITEHEVN